MKSLRQYIAPAIFICGIIILVVMVINPALAKVKVVKQDLVELTSAEKQISDLLGIYDSLRQKYQQITESDKATLEKALPANINTVRLILEMERIAESCNLGFKDVNVSIKDKSAQTGPSGPDDLPDDMRAVTAKITVVGDYSAYLKFLSDLEKSLRIVTIRSVAFSESRDAKAGPSDVVQTEYNIELETYWFVYPDLPGAPSQNQNSSASSSTGSPTTQ